MVSDVLIKLFSGLKPNGKDIVQPIEYDRYGRLYRYLPYRGNNRNGNYVTTVCRQRNYYLSLFYSQIKTTLCGKVLKFTS